MSKTSGDVTRMAVERALPIIAKAKAQLSTIVYTGPNQVAMTERDLKEAAINDPSMLKYAQSPDSVDNQLLVCKVKAGELQQGCLNR